MTQNRPILCLTANERTVFILKRLESALLAGLMISLVITLWADFSQDCAAVRGQVLRLHVLAASDSPADQQNKLAVRDAILAQSSGWFGIICG